MNTNNYIPSNRFRKILASAMEMMHDSNQPEVYKKLYIKIGYLYADFMCRAIEQRQKGLNNKIARRNRSVGKNKFATQMNRMLIMALICQRIHLLIEN